VPYPGGYLIVAGVEATFYASSSIMQSRIFLVNEGCNNPDVQFTLDESAGAYGRPKVVVGDESIIFIWQNALKKAQRWVTGRYLCASEP
jgi:hypothetical protein